MAKILLNIAGYPDSDEYEVSELSQRLQRELLETDVDDVAPGLADAPHGAKGAAVAWNQLIVTSGRLGDVVQAVIAWSNRHPDAAVSLEIHGDTLTLRGGGLDQHAQDAVDAFVSRHYGD
jgi:hypothetical protein